MMNPLELKVAAHKGICEGLNALYAKKNRDYNDAFAKTYAKLGLMATALRLNDKVNRLEALCTQEAAVLDESVEDTLMDIANYAIMTLIEMHHKEDFLNG